MEIFIEAFWHLSEKIFWSMWVSVGFAILFNIPRRAMFIAGLLGGVGFSTKFILMETLVPGQVVFASFIGACLVGILGMYFAHRVHTPPIVFTIPAVINMIPGKYGYEFMMGLIKIVITPKAEEISHQMMAETLNYGLKTGFIAMALSIGVAAPMLLFNTYSVKNKDLHRYIRKKILKRD